VTSKASNDDEDRPAVWEATEAAQFEHDGQTYSIVPGNPGTTFADGHPVVAAHPHLFKRFIPQYDYAPRSSSAAGQRGARTR
jgi:hypothetical protein